MKTFKIKPEPILKFEVRNGHIYRMLGVGDDGTTHMERITMDELLQLIEKSEVKNG